MLNSKVWTAYFYQHWTAVWHVLQLKSQLDSHLCFSSDGMNNLKKQDKKTFVGPAWSLGHEQKLSSMFTHNPSDL